MRWIAAVGLMLVGMGLMVMVMPSHSSAAAYHGTPFPTATSQNMVYSEDAPTYYQAIKPIFDKHCAACHTAGGIGQQDFDLETVTFTPDIAADIAFLTGTRAMPPWMPGEESPPLKHERKLSEEEIATVETWAKAGAPLGDPSSATETTAVEIPTVRADLILEMPEPYTPETTLNDDYRCFLIDPALTEDTFVTAYTVQPQQTESVHHVILYKMEKYLKRTAQFLDGQDERPGWECFGGSGVGDSFVMGGWTPGSMPVFLPENTGYLLRAGEMVIMQVHYNLTAGVKPDQTRAVLQLADSTENIQPLDTWLLVAPVELPCPSGMTSPNCEREAAIQHAEQYKDNARQRIEGLLQVCGKTVEDYASQDASAVTSDCTGNFGRSGLAIGILPHMHTRGSHIRVEINPDTPDAQVLVDIPYWDFHWQGGYQFAEPIPIQWNDDIKITCTWDNSKDENPRYIVWGEGTDDEMCLAFITVAPPEK